MTRPRAGWPPRWATPVPPADVRRGDGPIIGDFVEATCRVVKDSVAAPAGALIGLRPWQRRLTGQVFARRPDGRFRHRTALVGMARKNGKSALGAGWGLAGLLLGPAGGEVYSCAGDRQQARIVFDTAREMVRLDPELSKVLKPYRDVIECPTTGSFYRVLSAEAYTKEGLNPTLVIFDEVHVQPSRELWDVMELAMGARVEPMMVGITTAGARTDRLGRDSLCYQLYQYGVKVARGEVTDSSFYMAWWEPHGGSDAPHDDLSTWRESNPGFGDLVAREDFESRVLRTPEPEFRTKRCNQWVSSSSPWLPSGWWEAAADRHTIPDGERVVLAFDGSYRGDSTAITATTVGERPHTVVVGCWERPPGAAQDWVVPVGDVEETLREACHRWDVVEIACDTARWMRTFQILQQEGLPVVEFPQSPARMTPATALVYEAVGNKGMTHDGDERLERHVANAQLRTTSRGSQLSKETDASGRKIDLAVAMVMGVNRAHWWATQPVSDPMIYLG